MKISVDVSSKIVRRRDIYKKTPVELPAPRFIIFYNGTEERPEREILKLSDLYSIKEDHPSLELEAVFININPGSNRELPDACRTLSDYAQFTCRIRKHKENMSIEEAVKLTVDECIEEGILRDFLISQKVSLSQNFFTDVCNLHFTPIFRLILSPQPHCAFKIRQKMANVWRSHTRQISFETGSGRGH